MTQVRTHVCPGAPHAFRVGRFNSRPKPQARLPRTAARREQNIVVIDRRQARVRMPGKALARPARPGFPEICARERRRKQPDRHERRDAKAAPAGCQSLLCKTLHRHISAGRRGERGRVYSRSCWF